MAIPYYILHEYAEGETDTAATMMAFVRKSRTENEASVMFYWKDGIKDYLRQVKRNISDPIFRPRISFFGDATIQLDPRKEKYIITGAAKSEYKEEILTLMDRYPEQPSIADLVTPNTRMSVETGLSQFIEDDELKFLLIQNLEQTLVLAKDPDGICCYA